MTDTKPVIPRALARTDVETALEDCLDGAGPGAALRLVDAIEAAYERIGRHPAMGSPRYSLHLEIPRLRTWVVEGVPYIVFYVEAADHIDVWRVLHGRRDVPARLAD